MRHSIAREFTFSELLRFSLPSIIMMICMSLYTIVDGFFIARFAGPVALAASNLVYPLIGLIVAVGVMFATGGCAVVAVKLGQGKRQEANRDFTLITVAAVLLALVISAVSLFAMDGIIAFLGAEGETARYCKEYLFIIMLFAPASALQMVFQDFLIVAGRPHLGLGFSVASGILNILLDYVFMVPLGMGIRGAAWGTVSGYLLSAVGGLVFFLRHKKGLTFAKPSRSIKTLLKSCGNGSSEMVTNLAGSITTLLFNFYMLRMAGSDGVAAVTAVLYCQFLMNSFYIGFSIGVGPIVSYHLGAGNKPFLRRTIRRCTLFVCLTSVLVCGLAFLCAGPISAAFFTGSRRAGYGDPRPAPVQRGISFRRLQYLLLRPLHGAGKRPRLGNHLFYAHPALHGAGHRALGAVLRPHRPLAGRPRRRAAHHFYLALVHPSFAYKISNLPAPPQKGVIKVFARLFGEAVGCRGESPARPPQRTKP